MDVTLSPVAGAAGQFFNNDGVPLAGGLIYTYLAGTTTPQATYTTSAGTITNSNPIVLDSAGRTPQEIWLIANQSYKFVLKDSNGTLIGTYDNLSGSIPAGALSNNTDPTKGDALIGYRQSNPAGNLPNAVGKTVHDKFQEFVSLKDFGAVGDGVTDDTTALINFFANVSDNTCNYLPPGIYLTTGFNAVFSNLKNVKIQGEGATIQINTDQASGDWLFNFANCSNVEVSGLNVNGDAYITNVIWFDTCQFVNYHHNIVQNLWRTNAVTDGFGFYCEKSSNIVVANNIFSRVAKSILFDESSTTSSNVTIQGNTLWQGGHAGIIPAHKNCSVVGNTIKYASMGPWPDYQGATRADMRNPSWMPTTTAGSTYYGGGKGCAINTGSGLPNSYNCWPENVTISNNVIDYVAEYGIGIEGIKYIGTQTFAGPAINCVIANNTISNTGIEAIFVTGIRGIAIEGNNIINPGLSQTNTSSITCIAKGIPPAFSGETLANKQLNGLYGATIIGNNVRDYNGYIQYGIFTGPANIEAGMGDCVIKGNNFVMAKTGNVGIEVYGDLSGYDPRNYKINISDNNFGMSANVGGRYLNIDGLDLVNSNVYSNLFNGFTDWYYVNQIYSDFKVGEGEGYSLSGASVNWPDFVSGTVAIHKAVNTPSGTVSGNFVGFETISINGPSQGYFGYYGQGSGGSYVPGSFLMGFKTGASTWEQHYSWTTTAFSPVTDNTKTLGTSGSRWSVVYAATGTINTSDERDKQDVRDINELERQVAIAIKGLIKAFRFKDSVEKKGENARIHFGVMAQQVAEAFKIVGLDPDKYALFCYDEWKEELDADGNVIVAAGNRYGIRYDELLAFVISAL